MKLKRKVTATLERKPRDKEHLDEIEFVSRRHAEDEYGYSDNNIAMVIKDDGALFFSDEHDSDSGFVYLYPEQVEHLRKVLRVMTRSQRRLNSKVN